MAFKKRFTLDIFKNILYITNSINKSIEMKMKKQNYHIPVMLLILSAVGLWTGGTGMMLFGGQPDFVVSDILVQGDGFLYIKLKNHSPTAVGIQPGLREKIFLTIYINNLKRAEYKIKYLDYKLFKPGGTILFRTNFRLQKSVVVRVEVNSAKIIAEKNYSNNRLAKQISG
jgi:hypothetical protein